MDFIEVYGLEKRFQDIRAVDHISFTVKEGQLFAFLGLNGAGKSTTINILCSILKKDDGQVHIGGYDLDREGQKIKEITGIVFQNSVLDGLLSVKDNLVTRASYYGLRGASLKQRMEELTELLELEEILRRPYGKLSGGQRRRVDIARALLMRPKLLFLDEPTTGLDPKTRRTVWELMSKLQKESGMTVFLTTHYMEEAEQADDVVIMDTGKIAAKGAPHELKMRFSGNYIHIYGVHSEVLEEKMRLEDAPFIREAYGYRVKGTDSEKMKSFIRKFDEELKDFEVIKGNMDDVFLNVTGKKLEGDR